MTTDHRALPLLDRIRVASPCHEPWASMQGDDHVRHCDRCDRHVYDLSSLSRLEAERLVTEREGGVCVRFYRRADGTVLTADCPVGVRRRRRWLAFSALAVGTLSTVAGMFLAPPVDAPPVALVTPEPDPLPAPPATDEPPPPSSAAMVYEPPPVVLSSAPINPPPPRAAKVKRPADELIMGFL